MTEKELLDSLIENLKSKVINLPIQDFENIYSAWLTGEKANKWVCSKKNIHETQYVPKDAYLMGIDLPYWLGDITSNKKIMVVGIDPMRNNKTFENAKAHKNDEVILSTPFAVHLEKQVNRKLTPFLNFINEMSSENFVYLTDIYKTFFYTDNTEKLRSYVYYGKNITQFTKLKEMFFSEIEIVQPDIIITLGGVTFHQLTNEKLSKLTRNITQEKQKYYKDIPVLPLMHLTGSYDKNIKEFLKVNYINIDNAGTRLEYGIKYSEIVKDYLNR